MIHIQQLTVHYGDHQALHIDQPIHIAPGDRVGIIGKNGAGKSTLLKALLNLVPWKGQCQLAVAQNRIGVHLQRNNYVSTMPVSAVMTAILGTTPKKNERAKTLIDFFGFEACLKKRYDRLSGGEQQKMTLILVLSQDHPLVFLDEVTSGLDFITRENLMHLLNQWYDDKNTTLCLISHYYDELEELVNKILLLDDGHVVAFGDKDALFQKYIGQHVYTVPNTETARRCLAPFPQIITPEHLLGFSPADKDMESALLNTLFDANLDYTRSSQDIELMSVNALAAEKGGRP